MADAPLVIGDVAVYQNLLNDYSASSFNTVLSDYEAGFGGCLMHVPADEDVKPGKQVDNPSFTMIGAASRLDITATAAVSSTAAPASTQARGPVITDTIVPKEFFDFATRGYKKSPEQVAAELGIGIGRRLAESAKKAWYNALVGAVSSQTTPTHTKDATSGTSTLELTDLFDAKALLGDAQATMRTCVMHSKQWLSLKKDLASGSNYSVLQVGDLVVLGNIPGLDGMRIILDDDVYSSTASAGTTYYAYLLGPEAGWIQNATRSPLLTMEQNVDKGARAYKVTGEAHYAVGVSFVDMDTNNTNSTQAQLAAVGNWSPALSHDHRDIKAVLLASIEA